MQETIGERVRRLRKERGLTQRDLCGPGVTETHVSRIESGQRRPSIRAIRVLAARLGVRPEEIEFGESVDAIEKRELRLASLEIGLRLGEASREMVGEIEEILGEAEACADRENALRARLTLGALALDRGEHSRALDLLHPALGFDGVSPITHQHAHATYAQALDAVGRERDSALFLEQCLEHVREHAPSDSQLLVFYATYLAIALSELGESGRAEDVLEAALRELGEEPDPLLQVRLSWSRARVAEDSRDLRASLQWIRHAISILETTENTFMLGRARVLQARMLIGDGNINGALLRLEQAERLYAGGMPDEDRFCLHSYRARAHVRAGQLASARKEVQQALAVGLEDDPVEIAMLRWTQAELALAEGSALGPVARLVDEALELFKPHARNETEELLRWWSERLRERDRIDEADLLVAQLEQVRRQPVVPQA